MSFRSTLVVLCLAVLVAPTTGLSRDAGESFLDVVNRALEEGTITQDEAYLNLFYFGFEPEKVRTDLLVGDPLPLKCLTPIILEYDGSRGSLHPSTISIIDGYLSRGLPVGKTLSETYVSPSGIFRLTYETSGQHAVPLEDVDPPNGVPDYVEFVAIYADSTWSREIDGLGYNPPDLDPGEKYSISFANMGAYGYCVGVGHGGSYIVIENDFVGFPMNQDPDGSRLGAAKVTVAHEFKHASQFNTDGAMSMGGWVELDATWMEDIVYDEPNDYYNYLGQGSGIANPEQSLDDGGCGSYDDCIWQHHLCQVFGLDICLEFMQRREAYPSEDTKASYNACIEANGSDWTTTFVNYATWNYITGIFSTTWLPGYEEADGYPSSNVWETVLAYPDTNNAAVARIATHIYKCKNLGELTGNPRIIFQGTNVNQRVVTLVRRKGAYGGGWFREDVPLDAAYHGDYTVSFPGIELKQVAVLVVNTKRTSGAQDYTLTIQDGSASTDVAADTPVALAFGLDQNRPNPFNPTTTISFTLPREVPTSLMVYNPAGRIVRTLLQKEELGAGFHSIQWDGKDEQNRNVASGVYHYRLVSENFTETKRMVLIR